MRIFISCDMEGVAGISDWEQVDRKKFDYARGRALMTAEVNAAIEGALDAGAKKIVVADAHGCMFNLLVEDLHPAAEVVQGRARTLSMMQGIGRNFDAAAFIGYHAMHGTRNGCLAHTYSGAIRECRLNGRPIGEPGLNAALAAYFNVPLKFLSGDAAVCREIETLLPGIVTAPVKTAMGCKAVQALHPVKARAMIREGIARALAGPSPKTTRFPKSPFRLVMALQKVEMADLCERIPGIRRKDATTVEFAHADYKVLYGAFLAVMSLSGVAAGSD